VSLRAPRPRGCKWCPKRPLELAAPEVARPTRKVQAILEKRPHPLVDDQARPKQLQRALLAKGLSSRPTPSATFQRKSKSALALASSSETPS
jgi:hypothetical protein